MKLKLKKKEVKIARKKIRVKIVAREKVSAKERILTHKPSVSDYIKNNKVLEFQTKPLQFDNRPLIDVRGQRWRTECGRYHISRRIPNYTTIAPYYTAVTVIDMPGSREKIIGDNLRTLEQALARIVQYHQEKYDLDGVRTNEDEFLGAAKKLGYDTLPQENVLVAKEGDDSKAGQGGGFKVKISVKPKDKWGFREGSRAAAINAVLTNEPMTPVQIEKLSNASSVHGQLTRLCELGHVVKLKDGRYKLKGADDDKRTDERITNVPTKTQRPTNSDGRKNQQSGKRIRIKVTARTGSGKIRKPADKSVKPNSVRGNARMGGQASKAAPPKKNDKRVRQTKSR